MGVPTELERSRLLKHMIGNTPAFKNMDVSKVAEKTPGYVGADLRKLVQLCLLKSYVSKTKIILFDEASCAAIY